MDFIIACLIVGTCCFVGWNVAKPFIAAWRLLTNTKYAAPKKRRLM